MIRKFLGSFILLSVFGLAACGGDSGNNTDSTEDECTKDPGAPMCQVDEPETLEE